MRIIKPICRLAVLLALVIAIAAPQMVAAQTQLQVVHGGGASFPGTPVSSAIAASSGVPASVMRGVDANANVLAPEHFTINAAPNAMVRSVVSRSFLNRIVTPFNHPIIKTTSQVKVDTVGQSVFVSIAPTQMDPIVLYVMDEGDSNDSIALMLMPRAVGPVEIDLKQPTLLGRRPMVFNTKKAGQWEQQAPYTDRLIDVMRTLAKGLVPPGYAFRVYRTGDNMPSCQQAGLSIAPRQVIDGQTIEAYVGALTNTTTAPIEFNEGNCAHNDVLAVASWPGPLLQPGQSTEVYIIVKRTSIPYGDEARPSALLQGAR